jgi:aspartate kinase
LAATLDNGGQAMEAPGMEDLVISGLELDTSQARVTVLNVPDQPGYAAKLFQRIGDEGVFVDMIVQNVSTTGTTHLSFTVPRPDAERAAAAARTIGEGDVAVDPALAKLSVMGVGMRSHTGVATRMFKALAERGINIGLINTSEVRINVATDLGQGPAGLECLKEAFPLPIDP